MDKIRSTYTTENSIEENHRIIVGFKLEKFFRGIPKIKDLIRNKINEKSGCEKGSIPKF